MTQVIFGIGVLIFFITVYGTVVAGGLRLTAQQLDEEPELAAEAGLVDAQAQHDISVSDVTTTEF